MEKISVRRKKQHAEVNLADIKESIVAAIREKYGMSVKDFSFSKEARNLKLNTRNLQSYLSTGSVSLPTLTILCQHFGIGELRGKTIVTRKVIYSLSKTSENAKSK